MRKSRYKYDYGALVKFTSEAIETIQENEPDATFDLKQTGKIVGRFTLSKEPIYEVKFNDVDGGRILNIPQPYLELIQN